MGDPVSRVYMEPFPNLHCLSWPVSLLSGASVSQFQKTTGGESYLF